MSKFTIDGQTYEMVESRLSFAEGRDLERVTGYTFQQITADPSVQGSLVVTQAFIWLSMRRDRRDLKFSDLDNVAIDEIEWEEDPAEPDPTQPTEAEEPSPT